jgi:hypothetical protein
MENGMRRILKALFLAWIGKKVYDYAQRDDEQPRSASRGRVRSRTRTKHA